ncbi:hypothetical protein CROQUDRAFT_718393 [Cronartium quercuum f. sp. fusiforme G11]|uniref:Uncharacterized protein n=1 Tax=Cronartium quercuum f. sp. fusiforme G11 TaxID=708437 RepID=A0A9P6T6L1_9BASI|nr:hypothetical protein CROQUDRAFT_718393 [Cronartium quercuum f. sp. fusiforme G11]
MKLALITPFLASCVIALPNVASVKGRSLVTRLHMDDGPTPALNCTTHPSRCPKSPGPSGILNYPVDGDTLTTIWDNSGYVNVSYTPVKKDIPEGSVRTSSVIFTLRKKDFVIKRFSDKFIHLGTLSVPADSDFSKPLIIKLALPARFYDGDNSPENDVILGSRSGGLVGSYGFQVFEQQVFRPSNVSAGMPSAYVIQFQSAGPFVNVTYVPNSSSY